MPDLSVVIVSWNTRGLLRDCLQSVFASAGALDLEVFVVDNDSADGSKQMVQSEFEQVQLIVNEENVGFAAANNQAFPHCTSEFILLLNSDTQVIGDALDRLVSFMRSHPKAGAIGPKVVHPHMRLQVLSCGYQPTLRTLFNHYFGLSSLFPENPAFRGWHLRMGVHDDRVRPVEWISGACLLVRRAVIDQVGPLSETWFMYAEDMEWCQRISAAGWQLFHVPGAVVEHRLGASVDQNKAVSGMWVHSLRSYYVSRARPSRLQVLGFNGILTTGLALRAVAYSLRGLLNPQNHSLWQSEARKFMVYAKAAMKEAL